MNELEIIRDIQRFRKKVYKLKKEITKMRSSKRKTKLLKQIKGLEDGIRRL